MEGACSACMQAYEDNLLPWFWTGSSSICTYLTNSKCVHGVGMSYRKAKWLPEADVMEAKPQLLRNFMQRRNAGVALQDLNVPFKDGCDRHGMQTVL